MVTTGPGDLDRVPRHRGRGDRDGVDLQIRGRRRVDHHWHGAVGRVVALVAFEHRARAGRKRRVGDDEHVVAAARQGARHIETQCVAIATACPQPAGVVDGADVAVCPQIQCAIERQVNEVVPLRLHVRRGPAGVGDRIGDAESGTDRGARGGIDAADDQVRCHIRCDRHRLRGHIVAFALVLLHDATGRAANTVQPG